MSRSDKPAMTLEEMLYADARHVAGHAQNAKSCVAA
jgi:hypothetical protein